MPLHDIYDIRVNWLPWGTIPAFLFFGVFIVAFSLRIWRLMRLPAGTPGRRGGIIVCGIFVVPMFITPAILTWQMAENRALGRALTDNRAAVFEGRVQDRHFGNYRTGRGRQSDTLFFQVQNQWFRAPFRRPYECLPYIGDTVSVAAVEAADIQYGGAMAHRVLRLRNTRACNGSVWGG